ncbi:AlpA family transcriptional regulator [Geobacter sp. DSM 9736]|uniref:helix-turn-helix transcriptional regulator n=1 Tax=Geobacter sp. DSM 9736 TaxID=1277350 RepID=UPI000B4FE3A7|nr:AlpA family phage regulatory protein [Geobacter sp. DSM 9736]SNB45418.1 transcriptional regulator, AlpA family [Geobacter sp. DSM 9736]
MEALMNQRDLMEFMKISRATLWRMQKKADFPKPVMLMNGAKRWRREEINLWLDAKKQTTSGEASVA